MPCHFTKANGMTFRNVCPAILGLKDGEELGKDHQWQLRSKEISCHQKGKEVKLSE